MRNSNTLPTINSYKDFIAFNNSLPVSSPPLNIERVSYSKNIIIVNSQSLGIDRFFYNYVLSPRKLTGKVNRLRNYDFSKFFLLLQPKAFFKNFQSHVNNLIMIGENRLILWEFEIEILKEDITITQYMNPAAEEVVIPYFITKIDVSAFNAHDNLKKVVIQDGSKLRSIENSGFWHCSKLKEINLPKNLKKIGKLAFADTGLESIELPDSITDIESGCFSAAKLKSVKLPSNLKTLCNSVFSDCKNLTEVILPKNLKVISEGAFAYSGLSSIEFPSHLKVINASAFTNCESLRSVIFNKELETIGDKVFLGCSLLSEMDLPNSLIKIGFQAFYGCTALNKAVVIHDRVEELGACAFELCSEVRSVTIGKGIKHIGIMTFLDCHALREVKILGDLTSIGTDAFKATSIEELVLPKSVKNSIYNSARAKAQGRHIKSHLEAVKYTIAPKCDNLKSVRFK